ncbi:MAG: Unknown protein [uncultured Sulfurovum sp.]|uniref:Uncharacterized protein n=1 Tax=uncultured Sulfurovum sp. TaxID=269237 RepID=A0A6S6S5W2_9BACT|nr:MAG: Unknown protein [uncultured Sulfurovum sp.]
MCKIGLTTKENPLDRINESITSNPYYELFNCYNMAKIKISKKELYNFEKYLHKKVGQNIYHLSGNKSEWIRMSPFEAVKEIEYYINRSFGKADLYSGDYEDVAHKLKIENRPDPMIYVLKSRVEYNETQEYIDYLMKFHKYPVE